MAAALSGSDSDSETAFKRRLRRLRQRVLLRTMARDLENTADLEEVCAAMSDLADLSLRAALQWLREEELIVVAMGKLGGRELNVSSDIDLVFVHPGTPEKPTSPPASLLPSIPSRPITCAYCGADFTCGIGASEPCWCTTMPTLANIDTRLDTCVCPACLDRLLVAESGMSSGK